MADAEQAAPKKGSNKIAIIGICVMMLVTGGFFGLKMRGGGAPAKTALKLGEIDTVHEFLVNLQDPGEKVYLRTEIAVQLRDGFTKEELDKYQSPIEDAITAVLRKYSSPEIKKVDTTAALKQEVAKAANEAIEHAEPTDAKKFESDGAHHADWDSDTGPILKVFFTSFAFQ